MAGQVKPPFNYFGGKTTLAPTIAALLPPHQHYVEPFAGSLAVLLAKRPSKAETVNDLDGWLVTFWRVLRDQPDELIRVCALTPHARDEMANGWPVEGDSDLEVARKAWTVITQSRANTLTPGENRWRRRIDHTSVSSMPARLMPLIDNMAGAAERLQKVSIENSDALDVIRDYGTEPSCLIYADPPYLGETRGATENYRIENMGGEFHERFADACNNAKATVVVSGYASELYRELFDGWHSVTLKAPVRMSGTAAPHEVLWSNRPLMDDLFGGAA